MASEPRVQLQAEGPLQKIRQVTGRGEDELQEKPEQLWYGFRESPSNVYQIREPGSSTLGARSWGSNAVSGMKNLEKWSEQGEVMWTEGSWRLRSAS